MSARDDYPIAGFLVERDPDPGRKFEYGVYHDINAMFDEIDALRKKLVRLEWTPGESDARMGDLEREIERHRPLHNYVNECRVEAPDVLHYVDDTHYDHRTDKAYNLLAVLKAMVVS